MTDHRGETTTATVTVGEHDTLPDVLGRIAEVSGAHSGALLLIDRRLPPLFTATPNVVETLAEFSQTPFWYENPPAHRLRNTATPCSSTPCS